MKPGYLRHIYDNTLRLDTNIESKRSVRGGPHLASAWRKVVGRRVPNAEIQNVTARACGRLNRQ